MRSLGRTRTYLACALALFMFTGSFGMAGASPALPSDVSGHWAEPEVEDWFDRGWITGYGDGAFRPDDPVSRAEFVAFVGRAYDLPDATESPGFDDVNEEDWHFDHVADAVDAGIIAGRDENTFDPNAKITRQESAVILERLLDLEPRTDPPGFADQGEIANWAEDAVEAVSAAEVVEGYDEDGTFRPDASITRAETVVVLDRGLEFDLEEAVIRPQAIREWVDYSREIFLAQAREYEDTLYLLVTYGEQPTGGYEVEITDVVEEPDRLLVKVSFAEPAEDEPVTTALTYPYDLEAVEPTDLPVEFKAEGATEVVPGLRGLDWLPPMVAGDEDIRILSPAPGGPVKDVLTVEGIEQVFEGTVRYRLLDADGREIESGITSGHGYDWGHFAIDFDLTEDVTVGEMVTVEVYSECPKSGEEINRVALDFKVMAAAHSIGH